MTELEIYKLAWHKQLEIWDHEYEHNRKLDNILSRARLQKARERLDFLENKILEMEQAAAN